VLAGPWPPKRAQRVESTKPLIMSWPVVFTTVKSGSRTNFVKISSGRLTSKRERGAQGTKEVAPTHRTLAPRVNSANMPELGQHTFNIFALSLRRQCFFVFPFEALGEGVCEQVFVFLIVAAVTMLFRVPGVSSG
jgi:hypothetical protein